MSRTYDPQSVVELPRLDSDSAVSVGKSLLTLAAKEKKLPANVHAAVGRLDTAVTGLQTTRLVESPPESGLLAAMRAEAAAWAGFEQLLKVLAAVPGTKAAHAQALLDAVFPDGLKFVRGAIVKRWPATQARIQYLAKEASVKAVADLGATELVAHLVHTHTATSEAAGITVPRPVADSPQIKSHLDAVKAALRGYVAQFVANASLDDTGDAQALADKLLKPLSDFTPQNAAKVPVHGAELDGHAALALAKSESVG